MPPETFYFVASAFVLYSQPQCYSHLTQKTDYDNYIFATVLQL